ncbi:MAG: lysophospholipid acyltransferase family protein [Gemmatimonadota bacterium]
MDKKDLQFRAAGWLGRGLLGTYFPLVRCTKEGTEHLQQFRRRGEGVIFVFWHGQLLPLVHHHRNEGIVVLVSEHSDGEYIAQVIHRHGFGLARGSSTRGGVKGLKGILRAAKEGKDLGFTPDGPKGPRHVFKPGALVAAQLTGLPLIPIGVGADRAWYLNSWDRFMVPKPFSSLRIRYGAPRWVSRRAPEEELAAVGLDIQEELKAFTLELNPQEARIREEIDAQKG